MQKKPSKKSPPEAVGLFFAHLAKVGLKQTPFCEAKGLDRIAVQRAVNGERGRFSVDFAIDMQEATGGDVPVAAWESPSHKKKRLARRSRTVRAAA